MKALVLLILILPLGVYAENLAKDSTMDTTTGWSGDRKFETVEDNRVLVLEAEKKKTVVISQEIKTRDISDLYITLRYRTKDYKGRGLQFRGKRQDGSSTFRTHELKADGTWHELKWRFSEIRGTNELRFSIELLQGQGTVLIDDVVVDTESSSSN
jgi:hypothetical protein